MLAAANVLHLLAHEFAGLRAGRLALPFVAASPFHCSLFRHGSSCLALHIQGMCLMRSDGKIKNFRLAGVAQLVEQLIRNQQVTRSSRVAGSKFPNDLAICASIVGLDPAARNYFVTTRSYFGYRDALQ